MVEVLKVWQSTAGSHFLAVCWPASVASLKKFLVGRLVGCASSKCRCRCALLGVQLAFHAFVSSAT